jgi:hypothetical protein
MICPHCRTVVADGSQFCHACGFRFIGAGSARSAKPTPRWLIALIVVGGLGFLGVVCVAAIIADKKPEPTQRPAATTAQVTPTSAAPRAPTDPAAAFVQILRGQKDKYERASDFTDKGFIFNDTRSAEAAVFTRLGNTLAGWKGKMGFTKETRDKRVEAFCVTLDSDPEVRPKFCQNSEWSRAPENALIYTAAAGLKYDQCVVFSGTTVRVGLDYATFNGPTTGAVMYQGMMMSYPEYRLEFTELRGCE